MCRWLGDPVPNSQPVPPPSLLAEPGRCLVPTPGQVLWGGGRAHHQGIRTTVVTSSSWPVQHLLVTWFWPITGESWGLLPDSKEKEKHSGRVPGHSHENVTRGSN